MKGEQMTFRTIAVVLVAAVIGWSIVQFVERSTPDFELRTRKFEIGLPIGQTDVAADLIFVNTESRPISVTGCELSCDCMAVELLPITVLPNSEEKISVRIDCSDTKLPIERNVRFYTNPPRTGLTARIFVSEAE
jgi:hypothetical protein